jgi:host factor-I protein
MTNFKKKSEMAEPRKKPPPVETLAEVFYYRKQIDARTEMVIVLQDGEEIRGTIEWYDLDALKINRKDEPNILLPKNSIKYMFKAGDQKG